MNYKKQRENIMGLSSINSVNRINPLDTQLAQPFSIANATMPSGPNLPGNGDYCRTARNNLFVVIQDFLGVLAADRHVGGTGTPSISEPSIERFNRAVDDFKRCDPPDGGNPQEKYKDDFNRIVTTSLDDGASPEEAVSELEGRLNQIQNTDGQNSSGQNTGVATGAGILGALIWFLQRLPRPGFSY
jgi:hypothetical protein